MRSPRSFTRPCVSLGGFLLAALLPVALPGLRAASEIEEVRQSRKEIEASLAGKTVYSFEVVSADEIIDSKGQHIATKDIKAYLKKTRPKKKGAYVFYIRDTSQVEMAKQPIEVFGDYGASLFVLRKTSERDQPVVAADPAATGEKKVVMMVGGPNSASHTALDKAPAMAGRPAHLQPGKLPPRVRYRFAPDADVTAAAEQTSRLLLEPAGTDAGTAFDSVCLVQPGAWAHLSELPELAKTKPMIASAQLKQGVARLEGRIVDQPAGFAAAVAKLRSLLAADGGGVVRAFKSAEMDHWWTFISLDIEEPALVIESKGGKYLFVIGWLKGHVFCLDELRALPSG